MSIWAVAFSLAELNANSANTSVAYLGIRFTSYGDDWLEGSMPMDESTRGPSGALHPGALAILAETLGSAAAQLCVDQSRERCLGQSINVSHPTQIEVGPIRGRATRVAHSPTNQVWQIDISDGDGSRVCVSHFTVAVVTAQAKQAQ